MEKKMVRKLTVNNIVGTGLVRTPENDWRADNGYWHRSYNYKGVDIDQLDIPSKDKVYININYSIYGKDLDYADIRESEIPSIERKYDPPFDTGMKEEFDIYELLADIDRITAIVDELAEKARTEVIDTKVIKEALYKEVDLAEDILERAKKINWFDLNLDDWDIKILNRDAHDLAKYIENLKALTLKVDNWSQMQKRRAMRHLREYGCVEFRKEREATLLELINRQ